MACINGLFILEVVKVLVPVVFEAVPDAVVSLDVPSEGNVIDQPLDVPVRDLYLVVALSPCHARRRCRSSRKPPPRRWQML